MSAVARSADCLESQLRRDNTNQLRSLCVQMIVQPRKACTFVKGLGTQGADRPGVRIDSESHPTRPTLGAAVRLPPPTSHPPAPVTDRVPPSSVLPPGLGHFWLQTEALVRPNPPANKRTRLGPRDYEQCSTAGVAVIRSPATSE